MTALVTTTQVAVYLWFVAGIGTLVCLLWFAHHADAEVERHAQAALATEAADWGEPSRVEVEAGWLDEANEFWLFPAPEFSDTPIFAQMRHEEDVRFAAAVLADIDDLPDGAA